MKRHLAMALGLLGAVACGSTVETTAGSGGGEPVGSTTTASSAGGVPAPPWGEPDGCEVHTIDPDDYPDDPTTWNAYREQRQQECCAVPGCETFVGDQCLNAQRVCRLKDCSGETQHESACPTGWTCELSGNIPGGSTVCGVLDTDESCPTLELFLCVEG